MADQNPQTLARSVMTLLSTAPKNSMTGEALLAGLGISDIELHQAVAFLEERKYVEIFIWKVGASGLFATEVTRNRKSNLAEVKMTERGKHEWKQLVTLSKTDAPTSSARLQVAPPVTPVGSPYGFTDEDWDQVTARIRDKSTIYVAVGCQYDSEIFNRNRLVDNLRSMIQQAVDAFNTRTSAKISAQVFLLGAGYAEHQFNRIARDILASDVCIFEMSDKNANVMIELGVALTWGVRVLPIRKQGAPQMPSDISGQTYAEYVDNASSFADSRHHENVQILVERAILKKQASR